MDDDTEDKAFDQDIQVVKARVLSKPDESGKTIYGFKTPKRKEALVKAAQECTHSGNKSGKKNVQSGKKTALTKKFTEANEDMKQTISSNSSKLKRGRGDTIKAVVSAFTEVGESSSDEELYSDDEDLEENSDQSGDDVEKKEQADLLDEYFEMHHSKRKQTTSDKTLSKLENPKMDQEELESHLEDAQSSHIDETLKLRQENTKSFDKWMFQMLCGFNVLIYGVGSKYNLLEIFRRNYLKDKVHIVINGFFPSLMIDQVLTLITEEILDVDCSFRNLIEKANHIAKHYQKDVEELYILVHNIDGHNLRSQNTQAVLGQLAQSKNIHMIASIDHINAPLIWDQNRLSAFSWVWYDTTTFEPYTQETSYENSLMVQHTGTLALSSLTHVLRSLTPNAKGIFDLLVKHQLNNEECPNYNGITFSDLYSRCREQFLVSSDSNLRAQLTEFKDHKLLKYKKGHDSIEYLRLTLDNATLKQYQEFSVP